MEQHLSHLSGYRIDGSVLTDMPIYSSNDVMFIEVVVVDAFNKTLVMPDQYSLYVLNETFTMQIIDPLGFLVFESQA
jgi:hypothetical protein